MTKDRLATEGRLLAAAEKIFSERGFSGTGVREIAKEAGVSVSLINRYFGSKDGLLFALAEQFIAHKREGKLGYPPQNSLEEEIASYLKYRLEDDTENARLIRLIVSQITIDESFRKRVLPHLDGRADRNFRSRIDKLKLEGSVSPDLDVDLLFGFIANFSFTSNFVMGILGGRSRDDLHTDFESYASVLAARERDCA